MPADPPITELLRRARGGEVGAEARLAESLEPVLRRLAGRQLSRWPDSMLESAALINEAWVRLCGAGVRPYEDRAHFLRAASRTMRSVLVDRARSRNSLKRGGGAAKVELDERDHPRPDHFQDLLALDEALHRLAPADAELAELRLFGGLTCREVAELCGGAQRTVERRWRAIADDLKRRLAR